MRDHRERLDASAPLGIPAHVTVLFPFMPPGTIDTGTLAGLGKLFAEVGRRSAPCRVPYCLVKTAWMVIALFIPIMPSWLNVRP